MLRIQIISIRIDEESDTETKKNVHVGLQQLNRWKTIATVDGIKKRFNYNMILEDLMDECRCNGRVIMDAEFGKVIQLNGHQRRNVCHFLVQEGIVKKKHLKIHGF
ncbi:translation factor SUI1-like [Spatholobus suberectus]|nr:translation factor SUI1-like [Spatholobus suberectus]